MAKSSAGKAPGTSRIRCVILEAETEGDLGQITQAIQNALRAPQAVVQQRIAPPVNGKAIMHEQGTEPEVEAAGPEVMIEDIVQAPRQPRGPRKAAPAPQALELDLTSEPSLSSFMQKANPKSNLKRYLAVAAWFKDCRKMDAITPNHVYTCFRSLKWPVDVKDFAQPLRDLKAKDYFTTPERGQYAINHLGLQEVASLAKEGE